jgi:hypothetical protein
MKLEICSVINHFSHFESSRLSNIWDNFLVWQMIKKSRWKIPEIFCSSKTFLGNKSPNFMILFVVEVGKKKFNCVSFTQDWSQYLSNYFFLFDSAIINEKSLVAEMELSCYFPRNFIFCRSFQNRFQ